MDEIFSYDVFVSHCVKDTAVARELAERLKRDGLRVWLDEWEIKPRSRQTTKQATTDHGLLQSRTLLFCLSRNETVAEFDLRERQTTGFRDPDQRLRRLIPVRLDDLDITVSFWSFEWLDWRAKSEEQYVRLMLTCWFAKTQSQPEVAPGKAVTERKTSDAVPGLGDREWMLSPCPGSPH